MLTGPSIHLVVRRAVSGNIGRLHANLPAPDASRPAESPYYNLWRSR